MAARRHSKATLAVAGRVRDGAEVLVSKLGRTYREEVPEYAALPVELLAGEVLKVSRSVVDLFFDPIVAGKQPDAAAVPDLEDMGRKRLEMGIPLEAMLHVYRIAGREVFNAIVGEVKKGEEASLLELGSLWVDYIDQCSTRASTGYIEASNERVRRIEARRGAVIQALIAATDPAEVAAVASEFSLSLGSTYAPVLVAADQGRLDDLLHAGPANSLAGYRGSFLLLLAPDAVPAMRPISDVFDELLAAWGDPSPPGPALRAEIEHVEKVLTAAQARGRRGVFGPDDLLVEQFALSSRRSAAALERSVLHRLTERDADGVLTDTLRVFMSTGSVPRAAETLVVHPNTVTYRLKRVAELTGLDPRIPAQSAVLVLAIALLDSGRGNGANGSNGQPG